MPAILGIHQSSGLSEISSQFHDECSAVSGFFCIDSWPSSVERKNLVLGPATFVTGCRPIVLVTTPPQPPSNARRMLLSDSVGGADDSRNGFSNFIPVNVTDRSTVIRPPNYLAPPRAQRGGSRSRHPVRSCFLIPFRGHLLGLRPELDRSAAGNVAHSEFRVIPATKREWLARHRNADVYADHAGARVLHDVACSSTALGEYRRRVSVRGCVFHLERLVDVLRADDHEHRPKNFILRYSHVGRHVVDDSRSNEVAVL